MKDLFPPGFLDDWPDLQVLGDRAYWYVWGLLEMQEQPLRPTAEGPSEVYRLLLFPSFKPLTVIRLSNVQGSWRMVHKQSTHENEHDLSPSEIKEFGRLLDQAEFWEMPSIGDSTGLDGTQAVLEGVRAGRYHVVDRWSPHGTSYAKLVEFLLAFRRD